MPLLDPTHSRLVLPEAQIAERVTLLAELQAALAVLGIQALLVRHRRLVLHAEGPWDPSGPANPELHIFLDDGTEIATTDGARYEFTVGPACPVGDPQAAAASPRNACKSRPGAATMTTADDVSPAQGGTLPGRRPGTLRAARPRPAEPRGYDLDRAWQLLAETCELPATQRGLLKILTE